MVTTVKPWTALRVLPPPAAPKMRRCAVPGCRRQHAARGWCKYHYARWYSTGDPGSTPKGPLPRCALRGCDREVYAFGLCAAHHQRVQQGRSLSRPLYGLAPPPGCGYPGCSRDHAARGWCFGHYQQWSRSGNGGMAPLPPRSCCTVPGCERDRHTGDGLCQAHYQRAYLKGDPVAPIERGAGNPAPPVLVGGSRADDFGHRAC